jgi:hypothetical protein
VHVKVFLERPRHPESTRRLNGVFRSPMLGSLSGPTTGVSRRKRRRSGAPRVAGERSELGGRNDVKDGSRLREAPLLTQAGMVARSEPTCQRRPSSGVNEPTKAWFFEAIRKDQSASRHRRSASSRTAEPTRCRGWVPGRNPPGSSFEQVRHRVEATRDNRAAPRRRTCGRLPLGAATSTGTATSFAIRDPLPRRALAQRHTRVRGRPTSVGSEPSRAATTFRAPFVHEPARFGGRSFRTSQKRPRVLTASAKLPNSTGFRTYAFAPSE